MQFNLILTAVLCFTAWMNLVQAINGPINACTCVALSNTKVPHTKIKGYTIQKEAICRFSAVVFKTVNGRTICSDPNSDWAKHIIQKLEAKTIPRPMKICAKEETTSGTAPSASTILCRLITEKSKPRKESQGQKSHLRTKTWWNQSFSCQSAIFHLSGHELF